MTLEAINPATGETLKLYQEMSPRELRKAADRAFEAQLAWRERPFCERAAAMRRAARLLRDRGGEYARLMALEMGKPVVQGRAEVAKCAWVCEHFAGEAERLLDRELVATEAARSYVAYRPLGVVLAVMPWNFPFWQVFRFAAPALMAGNAALLKHASNVPGCALAIEAVFRDAGFPPPLFTTLLAGSGAVGDLIAHPRVAAVALTGSTRAGQVVAARAGAELKKTVLELGGSDPYVILEDADLERAAAISAESRLLNSGQSCIAAKRFIVPRKVRREFERALVAQMARRSLGDPLAEATEVGPLARRDLRDQLARQVTASLARGAKLLLGGDVPPGPGAFYPPSVLTDVRPATPAYGEELFGPVAAVIPVAGEDEAIRVANDTAFGLGAAVFTRDTARGEAIAAERLEAGSCFVNALVRSDPRLPFGGIKGSGYGRELGVWGIREFVNVKTVWVA